MENKDMSKSRRRNPMSLYFVCTYAFFIVTASNLMGGYSVTAQSSPVGTIKQSYSVVMGFYRNREWPTSRTGRFFCRF